MKLDAWSKLLLLGAACVAVALFWWFPILYVRAYERRIPDLSVVDDRSGGIWFALLQAVLVASVYGSVAFGRMLKAASNLDRPARERCKLAGILLLTGTWSWVLWVAVALLGRLVTMT